MKHFRQWELAMYYQWIRMKLPAASAGTNFHPLISPTRLPCPCRNIYQGEHNLECEYYNKSQDDIPKQLEESGIWQGGVLNLNSQDQFATKVASLALHCEGPQDLLMSSQPASKQLNLNKLGDAGGFKFSDCPTQRKTDSSGCFGITLVNVNVTAAGFGKQLVIPLLLT
ncbi:MAG: hypothetical protein AB7O96_15430 [Pseudobdellovibrionaceae bacterium]